MTNSVNVPQLAHSIHPSVQRSTPARRVRKRALPPSVPTPAPAPVAPLDRAHEAAFFIDQLHSEIARKVLPALLQEMTTGNASWRNTRWLLQLAGDDQGKLSIPRLTAVPTA